MYYVLLAAGTNRDQLIERLTEQGVNAVSHYVPLHSSPAGVRYGRVHGSLEVTEDLSHRLVRLPLWAEMTADDAHRVAGSVQKALDAVG
jgi:dTDP-4-amino-4,6-dideoxygalactose transaminase